MPEPTSSTAAAVATLTAAGISIPMITLFGVPLGLRVDLMIAGFCGSLVAIILLNSVPGDADTWPKLLRTTLRRMFVAFASSITAGYLTPLALLIANLPAIGTGGGSGTGGNGAQGGGGGGAAPGSGTNAGTGGICAGGGASIAMSSGTATAGRGGLYGGGGGAAIVPATGVAISGGGGDGGLIVEW